MRQLPPSRTTKAWRVAFALMVVVTISPAAVVVSVGTVGFDSSGGGGVGERCRLCPQGGKYSLVDADLPSMVLPAYNKTLTCNQLQLAMLHLSAESQECQDLQAANAGYCACVDTGPLYECSFCPDGGVPSRLDETLESTGDLCRTLYSYVDFLPVDRCESTLFEDIAAQATECGCRPVEEEEEEEEVDDNNYEAANDNDEDQPLEGRMDVPEFIDVPPLSVRQGKPCTFCPDGSFPPDPSFELELFQGRTCGEYAQFINGLLPGECELQSERGTFDLFAYQCGCPNSVLPACSLSENSQLCTTSLLDSVQDENCECFNFCNEEFVGCSAWPGSFLGNSCEGTPISGCNYASAIDDSGTCHMCPDFTNNIGNPDAVIPPFSGVTIPGNPEPTCQEVVEYIEEEGSGGDVDCKTIRSRLSFYCGCEGTSPSCTLCPGAIQPSFADTLATGDVTCREFAGTVTTWEKGTCDLGRGFLEVMGARCGCITSQWPQCPIQQNPLRCTANLIKSTNEQCECYNFCGDQFQGCADYPGQLLEASDCPEGVPLISGCNRALATSHRCARGSISCPPPPITTTMLRSRQ